MPRIKQDEKDKSKQRILDSATKLFAQKGYDGVGIREICKEANANICMISYFWGGKKELYKGIVDNLIEKQMEYAKSFLNLDIEPSILPKQEQINLLYTVIDKVIEFLYGGLISDDLFRFLLQEQQSRNIELTSPVFIYVRKLIGAIFNKDMDNKEIIFKTVFIMSQINSPKILPAFSLSLLKQDTFTSEDKEIIRNNARLYIDALIKEAQVV
ncbi:CerR family C-terminal domain-containing protein [bacterium]|nr:CerR family C-terminal domain-containing protein [bacterium]